MSGRPGSRRGVVRGGRVLALLVAVVSVGACAGSSGPVEVPADELPFSLSRSPTPSAATGQQLLSVAFVDGGRLIPVARTADASVPVVEAAMRALLAGPSGSEHARGLSTSIPPATQLIEVTVTDQVAEVDLSGEFQAAATPDEVLLRVAQVVWTVVAVPGVTAVRLAIDGDVVPLVTDRGTTVERPVSAPDYASVAPT